MASVSAPSSQAHTFSAQVIEESDEKRGSPALKIAFAGFDHSFYQVTAITTPPPFYKRRSYSHASIDLGKGATNVWLSNEEVRFKFGDSPKEVREVLKHFPQLYLQKLEEQILKCTKGKPIPKEEIEKMVALGRKGANQAELTIIEEETFRPVIAGKGQSYILFDDVKDELIGSGTRKWVKLALGIENAQLYAAAICDQEFMEKTDWDLLFHEAQLLSDLRRTKGIIQLEGSFAHKTKFYFITDYFNCSDLERVYKTKIQLTFKEKLEIASQITLGLLNLHTWEVYHRDLNPLNIFVSIEEGGDGSRMVKAAIGDLGGAGKRGSQVLENITGAIAYLAPEKLFSYLNPQSTKEWIATSTCAADVWSLGLILFALFHQRPGTCMAYQIERDIVSRIRELTRKDISAELEKAQIDPEVQNILLHMLQIDPTKRARIGIVWRQFLEILNNLPREEEKNPQAS